MLRDGFTFVENAAIMHRYDTFPFKTAVLIKGDIVMPQPKQVTLTVEIP